MKLPTVLVVLCCLFLVANGAKILGVFPVPSISHQFVYQPIWKELSLRGHEVTVITPNPLKDPKLINLTELDVSSAYIVAEESKVSKKVTHWDMVELLSFFLTTTVDYELGVPAVQEFIKDPSQTFDLVISEFLNPVAAAFSVKYNCPLVGIASLSVTYVGHEAAGNPVHPVLYPDIMATFGVDLNFFERIECVLHYLWYRFHYYHVSLPKLDAIVKKHLGEGMPYLGDIEKNISILLLNTNPIIHKARPLPPNVIELGGGMHLKPKKPLPKDLKSFLDGAKEGVIYLSFGSNVKSIYIDAGKRKIILEALSELPYKVLWKFENDTYPDQPANVKISKWLPQQDLLRHPNIKLFITQGGLQSMEEAIHNNVPLVGMPFFADQFYNIERMEYLGIGRYLDFPTLTKDNFKKTVLEVILNPKYKNNIREISKLLHDQPMTGLEKAMWWIEYVIRHKDASHLKNPAVDMPWYQFLLLDVIAFLLSILLILLYIVYRVIKYVRSLFISRPKVQKKKLL